MDNAITAARLQDINEGLTRQTGGLVEAHFRKSKRFGAAIRICNLIRGRDVIRNYNALVAATGELGIGADTLDIALREMEEIGYVSIQRSGGDVKKIEERIPLLSNRYEDIGQRWLDSNPSDLEKVNISILDDLMIAPNREREIIKKYGIEIGDFEILKNVGSTGEFYKTYISPTDGSEIAYSPLYHDENPEKFMVLLDKFAGEDVIEKIRKIRKYQGCPTELAKDPVLVEAVKTGCIPTPKVTSTSGPKEFMFTPLQGVGRLEKCLLEKARAIVACARYGQHFAGITRIQDPLLILRALSLRKVIGPHSEIPQQYFLLHKLGVGRISRDPTYSKRYNFHLIDTEENVKALDLGIQYLTVKDIVKEDSKMVNARQLLLPGFYSSTTKTRMDLRIIKTTALSKASINKLQHLIIGGSSGIV